MRNSNPIIYLIIAFAFIAMFASKSIFIPALIVFFAYQYFKRKKNLDNPDSDGARRERGRYQPRDRRTNTDYERRREYQRETPRPAPKPRPKKRPNLIKKAA